jgi:4-hydroxy-3-methylbut-2-enyl diphosphate reductase
MTEGTADPKHLTVLLARPRGFCAGVDRAIKIVEVALERYGAPVFVRHEIVHNQHVVRDLESKGAVFVDELDEAPDDRPVVFSAHGVPKSVPAEAERRRMIYLDATCPLVSKVHHEAEHHHGAGRRIVMIGHSGHPEVVGTMGQLPEGAISLIENVEAVDDLDIPPGTAVAYITQTTLSVDDTAEIIEALKRRFPDIRGPGKEDICYATTNRQLAVKALAPQCDALIVVGSTNSSNSRRLVEVAKGRGCDNAFLLSGAAALDWKRLEGVSRLGITAGASAPEILVQELVEACRERFEVSLENVSVGEETVQFNLPRALSA